MYKFLFRYDTETEQIKEWTIKWMQIFKQIITTQQWEELWNKAIKFTPSYNLKEQ